MKPTRLVASLVLAVTAPSVTGAASPTVQPAHAATSYTYYTVEGGDTLTRIAKLYGVTVASIQQLNGMGTSTRITVGQKLKVKATSSTPWRPNLRYAQPVTSLQPAKPIAVTTNWTGVKVFLVLRKLGMGSHFEVFDAATRNKVVAFQKAKRLTATGIVDATTWSRLATGHPYTVDTHRPAIAVRPDASRTTRINAMIGYAQAQRGAQYTWGSAGPKPLGFDCSGLVLASLSAAGVDPLPITVNAHQSPNYLTTEHLYGYSRFQKVPMAQRQRGDLIFWFNPATGRTRHVAIYVGSGQMVEASGSANAVRTTAVRDSTKGYTLARYAVRPLSSVGR